MAGRNELVKEVAARFGVTDTKARQIVDAVFVKLGEVVMREGDVQVRGFGTFRRVETKARISRNPQTGEPVEVPAQVVIKFKQSKGGGQIGEGQG